MEDMSSLEKRLLSETEARIYCGMGRTAFRPWAQSIGALRKRGRRVLYDKKVIDKYLDTELPADFGSRNDA